MTQVNMLEAKTELSKLVKMLETYREDVIYIARDGKPVVMMTLIPQQEAKSRFGAAKGVLKMPDAFDDWDNEIEDLFGGKI